jgi:hypothetical protein
MLSDICRPMEALEILHRSHGPDRFPGANFQTLQLLNFW